MSKSRKPEERHNWDILMRYIEEYTSMPSSQSALTHEQARRLLPLTLKAGQFAADVALKTEQQSSKSLARKAGLI